LDFFTFLGRVGGRCEVFDYAGLSLPKETVFARRFAANAEGDFEIGPIFIRKSFLTECLV
jgi:hypothetical protein